MQKPTDAIEKEFNDAGVFFLEQASLSDPFYEGNYVGVEIEIAIPETAPDITAPDFAVSVVNRRKVAILFTDWAMIERDGQRILKLKGSQRIPEGAFQGTWVSPPPLCMSFTDLCFFAGNEAIPEGYNPEAFTKQRPETKLTDLGWYMPSRFADAFIDAFGKLNDTMLSGMSEFAMLYGLTTK